MPDPSHFDRLLPDGDPSTTLCQHLRGAWPTGGDLQVWDNPMMRIDEQGECDGLGTWFESAWKAFRSSVGARSKLPEDARFDKDRADKLAADLRDGLGDLEQASSRRERDELAESVVGTLRELRATVPMDALAAVPGRPELARSAEAVRDVGFACGLGAVARTLATDPAGLERTYRELATADVAQRLVELGGEVPEGLWMGRGEDGARYLGRAADGLQVKLPGDGRDVAQLLGEHLSVARETKKFLGTRNKDYFDEEGYAADRRRAYKFKVGDLAQLTHQLSEHARELARTPGSEAALEAVTALATTAGEAMRGMTGAVRPDAPARTSDKLTDTDRDERAESAKEAARELTAEVEGRPDREERDVREVRDRESVRR